MNKAVIFFCVFLLSAVRAQAVVENKDSSNITILDGNVILELSKGVDFPCIGIQLSDKNINMGMGTYLEIKKEGEYYLMRHKYKLTKFSSIDKAIEVYLKDIFKSFYGKEERKYGKKVWKTLVKEGALQQFLDISRELIDDDFLNSPWNETYG